MNIEYLVKIEFDKIEISSYHNDKQVVNNSDPRI